MREINDSDAPWKSTLRPGDLGTPITPAGFTAVLPR